MNDTHCRTVDSPIGVLTVAGHGGTVTHLCMTDQSHPPSDQHRWHQEPGAFQEVADQLQAYFAGELTEFDVTVRLEGTEFQRRVWSALREISYGETRSYGEIARRIGQPGAARAVGLANGRNPVSIIVPCHRVIGAGGALTGYGGGIDRKRVLLALEQDRHLALRERRGSPPAGCVSADWLGPGTSVAPRWPASPPHPPVGTRTG